MSQEFVGFVSADGFSPNDVYAFYRFDEDAQRLLAAIMTRLGPRVAGARFHAGWDQRGGRDYFFQNVEFHIRGKQDPCFFGFFHYRTPEERAGSWLEFWEWEHDDDPILRTALAKIVKDSNEAAQSGRLSTWLDDIAAHIRSELGLH